MLLKTNVVKRYYNATYVLTERLRKKKRSVVFFKAESDTVARNLAESEKRNISKEFGVPVCDIRLERLATMAKDGFEREVPIDWHGRV